MNAANGEIAPVADTASGGIESPPEAPSNREQVAEELRLAQRTLDSAKQSSEGNNRSLPSANPGRPKRSLIPF
ncbi:MAG: hypothetical protein O3C40_23580 [Planctomycetota bacterium]|nr:hypothetical protein [Planctomycetota bacterium]